MDSVGRLDATKGSDEDVRSRCCALTQRLHEEAGERHRLERLRARCRCSQHDGVKDMNEDITRRALAAALAAQAAKDSLFAEQQASSNKALAAARCRATVAERARDLADARASDASEALQEALSLHGIDRSALADRLPEKEDTAWILAAKLLEEAERRINAEQERSANSRKAFSRDDIPKADAVEAPNGRRPRRGRRPTRGSCRVGVRGRPGGQSLGCWFEGLAALAVLRR